MECLSHFLVFHRTHTHTLTIPSTPRAHCISKIPRKKHKIWFFSWHWWRHKIIRKKMNFIVMVWRVAIAIFYVFCVMAKWCSFLSICCWRCCCLLMTENHMGNERDTDDALAEEPMRKRILTDTFTHLPLKHITNGLRNKKSKTPICHSWLMDSGCTVAY